jgi:hypothetical protein
VDRPQFAVIPVVARALVAAFVLVLLLPAQAPAASGVSPADRAAINKLLDQFVPAVVEGKDYALGWTLVAGSERTGSHADWLKGSTPVQRYPAKGTTFHGWTLNYARPGDVGFDLLLQPRTNKLGAWSFRVEAQKLGGAWRITTWYPVAEFAPAGQRAQVNGPADLGPGAAVSPSGKPLLGSWVLVLPAAALALIVLGAVGFALTKYSRQRSRVRSIERALRG